MPLGGDIRDAAPPPPADRRAAPEVPPAGPGAPRGKGAPPRRRGAGLRALLLLGAPVAVAIVGTVALLLTRPAQKAGEKVQELLEPAPPPPHGVADTEVVVGMVAPLSGANRELGRGMQAGIEAAFGEVNEEGGVHGRRLRLVAVDDGFDPSRTLPAMRQLVETDGVFAVIGNVGTPTAALAAPYASGRKVVFFGALTGGDLLRSIPPDRYVFNFRPSYAEEAAAAVRHLLRVRRVDPRRIAVFAQEDELGAAGLRGVAHALHERGVAIDELLQVGYRRNTTDVTEAVAALRERARDVDAVVIVATYRPAAAFIRGVLAAGLSPIFTNVSAVDSTSLARDLVSSGLRLDADVIVTQAVPLATTRAPWAERYREALERYAPDARPGPVTLEGWVVGRLFAEALRRTGPQVDSEKLVTALHTMAEVDLELGLPLGFSPVRHQASRTVFAKALQPDGSYRQVALEPRRE